MYTPPFFQRFSRLKGNPREATATITSATVARSASDAVGNSGTGVELNSMILLFPLSGTHMLPEESKAGLPGHASPLCVDAGLPVVNPCWPITIDAFIPSLNGGLFHDERTSLLKNGQLGFLFVYINTHIEYGMVHTLPLYSPAH
jgi:hypothetical protein